MTDEPNLSGDPRSTPVKRWRSISAEALIAVSALMVSVVSLGVGIYQGYLNAQMVAAASWPYLTFDTGNVDGQESRLLFSLSNGGVGPARIQTFQLFFDGKPVGDFPDLMKACCGIDLHAEYATQTYEKVMERYGLALTTGVKGSVITAGSERTFISWSKPALEETAAAWTTLDRSRFSKISAAACYCSVLGECWFTDFRMPEPKKVSSCPAVVGPQFAG